MPVTLAFLAAKIGLAEPASVMSYLVKCSVIMASPYVIRIFEKTLCAPSDISRDTLRLRTGLYFRKGGEGCALRS